MQGSRTAADMIIDLETEKTSREIRIAKTLPAGPEENSRHTAGGQVGIRKTPNSGGKCKFQERNLQGAQRGFQELFCSFGRIRVKPGGSVILNMNSDGSFKYLGINVKACGKRVCKIDWSTEMDRIGRSRHIIKWRCCERTSSRKYCMGRPTRRYPTRK